MGYREVVTGPPPDPGLGQIHHSGSLPALQPPPHIRRLLLPGWERLPLLGRPASVCTFRAQPRVTSSEVLS